MAKLEAEAYTVILNLLKKNYAIQLKSVHSGYEVTVSDNETHSHYNGDTLYSAIMKIDETK